MAQAETNHIQPAPRFEAAFRAFELEGEISDLAQMARIAELTLHDVIGQTEFNGCEVVRHDLTLEGVARAIFAVSHVAKLIEALAGKHFGGSVTAH